MNIKNQHIAIAMFHLGKWKVNPKTGEVFTGDSNKPAGYNDLNGYKQYSVTLGHSQGVFTAFGHCLVYLWVYGTYNPELVIDHIDRDRANNCIHNLRAITQADNTKWQTGRKPAKEFIHRRLPASERAIILQMARNGLSHLQIAYKIGCCRQTVSRVIKQEWANTQEVDKSRWLDFTLDIPMPAPDKILIRPATEGKPALYKKL